MEPKIEYEVITWRCACGAMLGDVVRTNGIRRLTLYRVDGNITSVAAIITGLAEIACLDAAMCAPGSHPKRDCASSSIVSSSGGELG